MNHLPVPLEFSRVDWVWNFGGWKKSDDHQLRLVVHIPLFTGNLHPRISQLVIAGFLNHQQSVCSWRHGGLSHLLNLWLQNFSSESAEGNSEISPVTNNINENNNQPDYNLGINRHILRWWGCPKNLRNRKRLVFSFHETILSFGELLDPQKSIDYVPNATVSKLVGHPLLRILQLASSIQAEDSVAWLATPGAFGATWRL